MLKRPSNSTRSAAFAAAAVFAAAFGLAAPAQTPPPHQGYRFIDPIRVMGCAQDHDCSIEADKYLADIGVYAPGTTTGTAARGTSALWKQSLGFSDRPDQPNPGELRVVYWNAGDLGLARDMHCIKHDVRESERLKFITARTFACYVTNYRKDFAGTQGGGNVFAGAPDIQTSVGNAARVVDPVATVAMEVTYNFSLVAAEFPRKSSVTRSNVDFIAFDEQNGGVPFSPPLDTNLGVNVNPDGSIDNDPNHPGKASPGTCLACHGGTYAPASDPQGAHVRDGNFLPFNTAGGNFAFTADSALPQFTEAAQREAFRQLNVFVLETQPTTVIADLVKGWYEWCGGVATAGCFIDEPTHAFIPDAPLAGGACGASLADKQSQTCGWEHGQPTNPSQKPASLTHKVYQDVAAVYCRTCHEAVPSYKNVEQFNDWNEVFTQSVVIGNLMPFAEVPYNKYWSDAKAQGEFTSFFSTQPSVCVGACGANACNATCNVSAGQCMLQAHSVGERQQCIGEKKACGKDCQVTASACVNACPF